jgi:hypothetical protein
MNATLAAAVIQWLAVAAAGSAMAALIQSVKYRGFHAEASLRSDDFAWISLLSLLIVSVSTLGHVGSVIGVLVGAMAYTALWLDAVLFSIFTIELGPGGVGGVIVSVIYRELAELSIARRFFGNHRLFSGLPLLALVAHAGVVLGPRGLTQGVFLGVLGGWLAVTAVATASRRALRDALTASASLLCLAAVSAIAPSRWLPFAALSACPLVIALAIASRRDDSPGGVRDFLMERRRPEPLDFTPRPEHAPLLCRVPAPSRPSASHGLLSGKDVLLLTFESAGRMHFAAFCPESARAPFLERLLPSSLRSAHHACVSPTTNNAHLALYTSGYGAGPSAHLRAMHEAGYQSVYLTTVRTSDYGLGALLDEAGFQHIIDRERLAPRRGGLLADTSLLDEGLRELEKVVRGLRPFFLHVHLTGTHVPYRVSQPERFHRFDMADDRGRFLNGVEESDWIFEALVASMVERGLTSDMLVVLSSDHGQAFGKLGYQSHGSAVTREELDVPLLLHHPRLAGREVEFSSHFDVLPTVLDLIGLSHTGPTFGDSLLHDDRRPEMLVWAGHPSRKSTSHYGLLLAGEKLIVDLALDRCLRMDWRDEYVEKLEGAEKKYVMALASRMMSLRGVV